MRRLAPETLTPEGEGQFSVAVQATRPPKPAVATPDI